MAVGTALALAVLGPQTPEDCLVCVVGAAVGSQVCDVDADSSKARREAGMGWALAACLCAAVFLVSRYGDPGLGDRLLAQLGMPAALGGVGILVLTFLGARTAHRSFMHSLLCGALLGGLAGLVYPPLVAPLVLGFASHLALDLTNHAEVRLLWPLERGFSLGLFAADGWVNDLLFAVGALASAFLLARTFLP